MAHDPERWTPSDELLDRFLAEHTPPDERAAIDAWLARTPAASQTADALRQLRFDTPLSHAEHQAIWQRIERRVQETEPLHTSRTIHLQYHNAPRWKWSPWSILSGLALCTILMVTGWWIGNHGTLSQGRHSPLVYSTAKGERANITLPDGSTVALNVATRLEVPVDYGEHNRTVYLTTGEAQFHTVHASGVPFTVVAGTTTSRVLGTTFLIRHYLFDHETTVTVQDGKVAIGATVLTAGRMLIVDGHGSRTETADLAQFSFMRGTLTLAEMPLAQAIPELDRWYDADIQLGDPTLGARHIVGEFRAGSLADLRAILAMTFDARVVRNGRTLTLFSR